MKSKPFDCVEMKQRGAERVLAETAGMTLDQELDYWREATEKLESERRTESKPGTSPKPCARPVA